MKKNKIVKDMIKPANNAGTEDPHKLDNQDLKGTGMKWVTQKEVKKVYNKIHQKTLRGSANFMIISPSVATIIESIPGCAKKLWIKKNTKKN